MKTIKRIHVVDDDRAMRESTALLLRILGFEVVEWDGPASVLERAEFAAGDLLLVDYRMEGLTGVELLGSISSRGHRLPAVLMSGHFPSGPTAVLGVPLLEKPFQLDALLDAIQRACGMNRDLPFGAR